MSLENIAEEELRWNFLLMARTAQVPRNYFAFYKIRIEQGFPHCKIISCIFFFFFFVFAFVFVFVFIVCILNLNMFRAEYTSVPSS